MLVGKEIKNVTACFSQPTDTTSFNIYWAADIAIDNNIEFSINDINKKLLCLRDSIDNSYFFTPLISNGAQ